MLNLFHIASSNLFSSAIVSNRLHRPTDVYLTFKFFGKKLFLFQYDILAVENAVGVEQYCGKLCEEEEKYERKWRTTLHILDLTLVVPTMSRILLLCLAHLFVSDILFNRRRRISIFLSYKSNNTVWKKLPLSLSLWMVLLRLYVCNEFRSLSLSPLSLSLSLSYYNDCSVCVCIDMKNLSLSLTLSGI